MTLAVLPPSHSDPDWFDLSLLPRHPVRRKRDPGPPAMRVISFTTRTHAGSEKRQTYTKVWLSMRVRDHLATLGTPCVTLLVWPPDQLGATAIERIMVKGTFPPHGWSLSKTGYLNANVLAGRIRPGTTIWLQPHGLEFVGDVPKEARLQ